MPFQAICNRGRAMEQHGQTLLMAIAVQVDEYIDLSVSDVGSQIRVGHAGDGPNAVVIVIAIPPMPPWAALHRRSG